MNIDNLLKLKEFCFDFSKTLKPSDIICLNGTLGAGKTQFVKYIGEYFKIDTDILSPTFVIFKSYDINNNKIKRLYHFDLYRIKSIDELYDIDFLDYIYDDTAIKFIEWSDIAKKILPKNLINIELIKTTNINERILNIKYE